MSRWLPTAVYAAALILLAARAPMRTVGDGGEYLAYAITLSHANGPSLTPADVDTFRQDIRPFDPDLANWKLGEYGHASDGRLDFVHFWLYSAMAAPIVAVARVLDHDPRHGFTVLNVVLLVIAFAVVCRRAGWAVAALVLAGPILWWTNKAHIEPWVVSLLALALVLWRDRPGTAMSCAGLVAAQVPTASVFVPLLAFASIARSRESWRDRGFQAGLAAGALIALMPAVYYTLRFGTPVLLATAAHPHWPSATELGAVLLDLNIGLVPNWPLLALAVVAAVVVTATVDRHRLLQPDMLVILAAGLAFLVSFPQIGNFMHGGTPGIMRYAIWLAPLAIPPLATARGIPGLRKAIAVIALASTTLSVIYYAPAVDEFAHRPTETALWAWRHRPAWSAPLPEVFARSLDRLGTTAPIATAGCEKILLVGRGESQGMWPRPCLPADVPPECRAPGVLCYANRSARTYHFDVLGDHLDWLKYDPSSVWPRAAEAGVRLVMAQVEWASMKRIPRRDAASPVSTAFAVDVEAVFVGEGRSLLVLSNARRGARLEIREGAGIQAVLVEGVSGRRLAFDPATPGPQGTRIVTLPVEHASLVLALWTTSTHQVQ